MSGSYAGKTLAIILATVFITNQSPAQANGYAVIERGADYKVLQKTTVESGTNCMHKYVELATGMNYTNASGQWQESKEQITLMASGGAAAIQGQHQVYFPSDIYNGVLEVVTPDGRHLKSRPLGVSYDDGSNTVFIATLKNAQGYLTSSNQVSYRDAFTDFKADLVCTYRRSGFECDLVFRQQPPTPEQYGLNPQTTTLQMITEFFNATDPEQIPATSDEWYGLQDSTLKFGKLTMKQGKAFAAKNTNALPSTINSSAPVYKRWLHLDNRTFLIEELPLEYLVEELSALPMTASNQKSITSNVKFATNTRQFPPAHGTTACTNQILLAFAGLSTQPGVILDYNEFVSAQTNFTFQSGTTYLVAGQFNLDGTTTIEGGTVVKYDNYDQFGIGPNWWDQGAVINISGALVCATTPDNPAIFTDQADNSVGEVIGGTAVQGSVYLNLDDSACRAVHDLRFKNAGAGLAIPAMDFEEFKISNCQFVNCLRGLLYDSGYAYSSSWADPYSATVDLYNVLFTGGSIIGIPGYGNLGGVVLNIQQSTIDVDNIWDPYGPTPPAYISALNSIIKGNLPTNYDSGWEPYWELDLTVTNPAGMFHITAANANYYLATGSPYRDIGTTNIDSDLLTALQTMTTYAPQDGGMPDTNAPDLGYHYPVNEDSDHDGLPDWWEWHWFGNYTHSGSEVDANGCTLLSDYQNYASGTVTNDPNIIAFSIESTNDCVNHTNVSVQLNIQVGEPSYYAIFVNSTTTTNWLPFSTTNLTASLGSTDGVYNVVVGLKGLPTNAVQTWRDYRFTLDRAAPVVRITNPLIGSNAVTKPYVQLQGFADEPLARLSYDLSNAFGFATNLDVFVTDQRFDTNKFDFTTNYFQAYDVPLATNGNVITLRVMDRAGNTTTTNFNVVLDYASATNPPMVKLLWPTNGMTVSGTNCTLRGTMSDETGTIQATVVNGDGTTNVVEGLVERNNLFWIENVPLNGTNQITLQATDAAGNITTTNFTVKPSALVLTIDSTPTGDDLYKPAGTVSGTVSDPTATVTVNGTNATVETDGHWSAANVPVMGKGTATFDAVANVTGQPTTQNAAVVEMGPYWEITEYHNNETEIIHVSDRTDAVNPAWIASTETFTKDYVTIGSTNFQGNLFDLYHGHATDDYSREYSCPEGTCSDWSNVEFWWTYWDAATHLTESSGLDDYYLYIPWNDYGQITGVPDMDLLAVGTPPVFIYHYFAAARYHWKSEPDLGSYWPNQDDRINVTARTTVKLWTGGKAKVARQSLFCVSAWATKYGQWANDWSLGGFTVDDITDKPSLQVLGKPLGADGKLWVVLPDNSEQDITVHAPGVANYNAWATPEKYHLYIGLHTSTVTANLDTDKPEVCVGQTVTFSTYWLGGSSPSYTDAGIKWHLPEKYVNQPTNYSATCATYVKNEDLLTNTAVQCWYVNLPGGACSVRKILHFANGQYATIVARGDFTVYRPQKVDENMSQNFLNPTVNIPIPTLYATNANGLLELGDSQGGYARFWAKYRSSYSGEFQESQIVQAYRKAGNDDPVDSGSQWWGDGAGNKAGSFSTVSPAPGIAIVMQTDQYPGVPLVAPQSVINDVFKTYFQFKPAGDGIWVTMGRVNWSWAATSTYTSGQWNPPSGTSVSDPQYHDDDSFPLWDDVTTNHLNY